MRKITLWALLAALSLAACAEPDAPGGGRQGANAPTEAAEMVGFGEALAQIRGHHLASLELYRTGDRKGAALHAGHPIAEILDSVRSELEGRDPRLARRLTDALEAGANAVAEDEHTGRVAAAFNRAARVTEDALVEVVGGAARSAAYRGSVIATLLDTVAHEYEEAVGGGGLRLLAEYQDAYAFTKEARRLYGDITDEVEAASAEEAEEIERAFEVLESALPSPKPPARLAEKLDVRAAAELIALELEETVEADPVEETDPEQVVAEIERLLTQIEKSYAAGDPAAAAELAAEAYLENYEVIEAGVIEAAPKINRELEPLLGADLRREIQGGASQKEIESLIARARTLLHHALAALEGGH